MAIDHEDQELSSDDARKQGNDFFTKRSFAEALKWYHKAADLSPDDYRVPWNISAVYFEMGDYANTSAYTRKTLELVSNEAVRQKVLIREAKAHLHLRKLVEAQAVIAILLESDEKRHLQEAMKCMQIYDMATSSANANSSLVRSLPYYKPQMEIVREYYNVGHDKANTMLDPFLTYNSTATETLSFLFAGIGDARHLLQTFQAIAVVEAKNSKRRYHFTINDVKPEVFARDLLIFMLLGQLTKELPSRDAQPKTSSKNVWLILATLFYTFIGQVMPLEVYNHLQEVIKATIGALEQPHLLPRWIRIDQKDIPTINAALRSWQAEVQDTFTTRDFIRNIIKTRMHNSINMRRYGITDEDQLQEIAAALRTEYQQWSKTGYLTPPNAFMNGELRAIISISDSRDRVAKLRQHVENTWKINPTLIDIGFVRQDPDVFDIGHNPFELEEHLYGGCVWPSPGKVKKLFDYTQPFFIGVARAIEQINEHLTVEVITGDITRLLEGIQHGLLTDRDATYPTRYDRIHLSNIPDYIGGSLFNYIYALPLLKDKPSSFVCSTCLRNPPKFPTLASFDNEYALLPDASAVQKVFKAQAKKLEDMEGTLIPGRDPIERLMGGGGAFSMSNYWSWRPSARDASIQELWSRQQMEKWLYQLFMKTVLPTERPTEHFELIYSPSNSTAFFRVLETIHGNGYPVHWLADVVLTLLANRVKTTARPPRSYPLQISETSKEFKEAHVDLSPFMVELRVLTALWLPELPFGLASPLAVPFPSQIRSCSIKFTETIWRGDTKTPVFSLLFCKGDYVKALLEPGLNIRAVLLSDERRDKSASATAIRKNCAVINTWEWAPSTKTGSFWLDEEVARKWKQERWIATILRMDSWIACAMPVICDVGLYLGGRWDDQYIM